MCSQGEDGMKRRAFWLAGLVFMTSLAAQPQSNGFALAMATSP